MEIKVIVGNVEIYYYQESEATAANSATTGDVFLRYIRKQIEAIKQGEPS